jgi:copper chaperone CopZ
VIVGVTREVLVTTELKVTGMTCDGCKSSVERVVKRVAGVTAATVDLPSGRLTVEGTPDPTAVRAAVEKAGYGVA